MTIAAVGIAVGWVLATCWRVARPAPGEPAGPRASSTTMVVDVADGDRRGPDVARFLSQLEHRTDLDPGGVIVVVRGPGESITDGALARLAAELGDPDIGAVQPGVRAASTGSLLAELQDMEWVGLAELHGRRGQALGMLGAGPASPAYRWAAVRELDGWPAGRADDVVVAAALTARGWRTAFAPGVVVTRTPARSLAELLRERIQSAGGLLRALRALPSLVRGGHGRAARALLAPVGLLLIGMAAVGLVVAALLDPAGASAVVVGDRGERLLAWYAVLFAPAWVAGFTYWMRHGSIGVARSLALGHLFVAYSLHWIVAVWIALLRLPFERTRLRTLAEGAPRR